MTQSSTKTLALIAGGIAVFTTAAIANPLSNKAERPSMDNMQKAPVVQKGAVKAAQRAQKGTSNGAIAITARGADTNIDCANATSIACGDTVDFVNSSGEAAALVPTCSFANGDYTGVRWFSFEATNTSATVAFCDMAQVDTGDDSIVAIYEGTCGGLVEIGCNDDACGFSGLLSEVVLVDALTVGDTYYIQALSYSDADLGTYQFTLTCDTVVAAANDACDDAISLACGSSTVIDTTGALAAAESPVSCGFGGGQPVGTLWYSFEATANAATVSTCNTAEGDSLFAVYEGTCAGLVEIGCAEDGCGGSGLLGETIALTNVGDTYYIQIGTFSAASAGEYTLDITCEEVVFAANDDCDGAIDVACGSTTTVDLNDAAPGYNGTPGGCYFGGGATATNSLWYSFMATETAAIVSTCDSTDASATDSVLQVYEGTCGGLVEVACGEDGCGPNGLLSSAVVNDLTVGDTYYIQLAAFGPGSVGIYDLNINCLDLSFCSECPVGGMVESEASPYPDGFVDDINGGCVNDTAFPPVEFVLNSGDIVCATAGLYNELPDGTGAAFRDVDNTAIDLTFAGDSSLTIDTISEDNLQVAILDITNGCDVATVPLNVTASPCTPLSSSVNLAGGGQYLIFTAAAAGVGIVNGEAYNYSYQVTLDAPAVGACCFSDGSCSEVTSIDCADQAGIYQGDDVLCAEGPCCEVACDGDAEGEVVCFDEYDDVFNAGCNSSAAVPPFTTIVDGQTYCGTTGFFTFTDPVTGPGTFRDTDWYLISHAGGPLGFTLESENMIMLTGILSIDFSAPVPCDSVAVVVLGDLAACIDGGGIIDGGDLPAGDYIFFVGGSFNFNAGTEGCGWEYKITAELPSACESSNDLDGSGLVDLGDLNEVLGNFGNTGEPGILGDTNCDGAVDLADLNLILGNFGNPV